MNGLTREFHDRAALRLPAGMRPSPFTDRSQWLGQTELAFAMVNYFPSTPGHMMVLPRDFAVYRFFELARDEIAEHHRFARVLKSSCDTHFKPDGYNIGWNVDFCGGQSIAHAHMHIMPRYHAINRAHGIDPRGGVARLPFPRLPDFSGWGGDHIKFLRDDAPILAENDKAFAVQLTRAQAVTPGHTFIFTRRPRRDFFTAQTTEVQAQLDLALTVMNMRAQAPGAPDGYNIGWDSGVAAGQVGGQCYLQIIPRYRGDMDTPRGGIVRIVPEAAWPMQTDYYDKKNIGKDVVIQDRVDFPFTYFTKPDRSDMMDLRAPSPR